MIDWGMRAALGENVSELTKEGNIPGNYRLPGHGFAVKMPVFPFNKFKGFDPILGPEMRSTGEVMGVDKGAGAAFAKAFLGAGISLPTYGRVLFSLRDSDKTKALNIVRLFEMLGFEIAGTPGTAEYLKRAGVEVASISKIGQGNNDENLLAWIRDQKIQLIINTPGTRGSLKDGMSIRQAALRYRVPLLSTLSGAEMACLAIKAIKKGDMHPIALQDFVSPSI
jgi:carbamoyl-phosphate synthase large subunit